MIAPLLSDALRSLADRLIGADIIPDLVETDDLAEILAAVLAREACTCGHLTAAVDPEEHEAGCAYLDVVDSLETAALARREGGLRGT